MLHVILVSVPWRIVTGALIAVTWLSLPTYVLALFLLPPVPPIVMIRSFAVGTALPAAMAWAILRLFAGTATVEGGVLRLRRGDLAIDVTCNALRAPHPWWIALPRAGVALRLGDGRRVPVGVATDVPDALLDRLAACGVDVAAARRNPTLVAAATRRPHGWLHAVVKFPLLGTLPAAILFYTHQHIAYGGTFGQYYLEGPLPYLSTFAQYWGTTIVLLVSYAAILRGLAEVVVWLAATAGRRWAAVARRVVEVLCALAYYAGVPALLALRYLA